MKRIAIIDFADGAKVSDETTVLQTLVSGSNPVLYNHTKKTQFSVWLAIRRSRMKKNFKYDNFVRHMDDNGTIHITEELLPTGQYYIWVE